MLIWVGYGLYGFGSFEEGGVLLSLVIHGVLFHIWAGSSYYQLYYIIFDFWSILKDVPSG